MTKKPSAIVFEVETVRMIPTLTQPSFLAGQYLQCYSYYLIVHRIQSKVMNHFNLFAPFYYLLACKPIPEQMLLIIHMLSQM